jgi:hypothetical protein
MTIKGLSMSKTYDIVIYSDWYWKDGDSGYPVTQTLGTGLVGTIYVNRLLGGPNGIVPPLTEDTNPLNDSTAGNTGNWYRIKGLTPDANGQLGFRLGDGANGPFSGFQLVYPTGGSTNTFATWAATNAPGQTPSQDYDNDGVENGIEYFMGESGSSFTAMPGLDAANTITWSMDAAYSGTYEVQTSPDLVNWTNVDPKPAPSGGLLSYTLPSGAVGGKSFVRLFVAPAP